MLSIAYGFAVDNLPVATMSAMGASTIFACDVGSASIIQIWPLSDADLILLRSMIILPEILVIPCQDGGC